MPLFLLLAIPIKLIDIIDILLVALLLFQLHKMIKGTTAINIFLGIIAIYILYQVVKYFELKLLSEILGQFVSVGFIALIIVFQQEIRKFLLMIGTPRLMRSTPFRSRKKNWQISRLLLANLDAIVQACREMSLYKTGALIVISKQNIINQYIDTGQKLDSNITKEIIESIFNKNSPLHDGALIIADNKIKAVRCILPISEKTDLPPNFGLRHRAGIGLSEHSDAMSIIVSEQTGNISFCSKGNIAYNINASELKYYLKKEFKG